MSHDPATFETSSTTGDDLTQVATYRPVCGLAIVALLLGLAAPLAILTSLLWFLPLVGLLFSLVALRKIAGSDGTLAGRSLALVGLAVAVASGGMVATRQVVQSQLVGVQGTPWGIEWSRLILEGKVEEALELTYEAGNRRSAERLTDYYQENPTAQEKLAQFRETEVVKLLADAPAGSTIEPIEVEQVRSRTGGGFIVYQAFRVVSPEGESRDFTLELHKSAGQGKIPGTWHVQNSAVGRPLR